jgi:hypothetical protein
LLAAIVVIFIVAYAAIALEHPLRINKSASALLGAGLLGRYSSNPKAITLRTRSARFFAAIFSIIHAR